MKCCNSGIISLSLERPQGVPIEVVPFAYAKVLQDLHNKLGSPKAALRIAVMKGELRLISLVSRLIFIITPAGPVVTDNGNFVIDAPFDHERLLDPYVVSKLFFLRSYYPKILNGYLDNVADKNANWRS